MSKPCEIVVVSSDLESRQRVAGALSRLGVNPICVSTIDQCRHIPKREKVGIVFCDKNVEGGDYQDVMAAVSSEPADARTNIGRPNGAEFSTLSNRHAVRPISNGC